MPTGMGVASPKFSKSNIKPEKTKHCTIPNPKKKKQKQKSSRNKGTGLNEVHMEGEIL